MTAIEDLRQSLDSSLKSGLGRPIDVFFRDDDADDDVPNLHRLLDLFGERAAPINLAVIPGTLSAPGAELLLRCRHRAPAIIELGQHGWMHTNHEMAGRKCEFGPSRRYPQQLEDIARGRDLLNRAFGAAWHNAFIPPWNRCTSDTLRALDELGFSVLSADESATSTGYRLCEIPVTFDIFTWKKGAALKAESDIAAGIAAQVRAGKSIGILLHHKIMTRDAFGAVATLLDEFARSQAVRLHTLHGLLALRPGEELSPCNR
jgi:peptidoglycan/xylan/chitin deacetylase (PgdA/CDA1 family)